MFLPEKKPSPTSSGSTSPITNRMSCPPSSSPSLRIIKAVDNKFKSLAVFKVCPKLEELYVAQNAFTSLSGWESLPALKRLHARRNRIEKVEEELPPLESLEYINLRQNKLGDMRNVFNLFQF